jgi:hypothetical protein
MNEEQPSAGAIVQGILAQIYCITMPETTPALWTFARRPNNNDREYADVRTVRQPVSQFLSEASGAACRRRE